MEEVRRLVDDELCGHVALRDGVWLALVVFGAVLGRHSTREGAIEQVLADGLASLADRWTLQRGDGSATPRLDDGLDAIAGEVVCIQEANAQTVTLVLGYYSIPGVPTMTISVSEIVAGEWTLHRAR